MGMESSSVSVAFVLSGGANLGAAQAGMLEALLDAGITPDLLVGTSIGAVNAAFLAAGPSPAQARALSAIWRGLSAEEFFPLHAAQVTRALRAGALYSPEPLRRLLEREIPYRLVEEASTRLRIVATRWLPPPDAPAPLRVAAALDRHVGPAAEPIRRVAELLDRTVERAAIPVRVLTTRFERLVEEVFASGPVLDALLASSALPLVFPAHRYDGHLYVDGGLSEYVPLRPAIEAGAQTIYVLSLGTARERAGLYRAVGSRLWPQMGQSVAQARAQHPGVELVEIPAPVAHAGLRDFALLGELVDQAREVAARFLAGLPPGGDLERSA